MTIAAVVCSELKAIRALQKVGTDGSSFAERIGKCVKLTTIQRSDLTISASKTLLNNLVFVSRRRSWFTREDGVSALVRDRVYNRAEMKSHDALNIPAGFSTVIINDNPPWRMYKKKMIFTNRARSSTAVTVFSCALSSLLLAAAAGCGGDKEQTPGKVLPPSGSPTEMTSPPVPGGAADPASSPDTPGTPPGTITLPDNFDPNNVPPPETNGPTNGAKEGGLKLPPLGDQSAILPGESVQPDSAYQFTSTLLQAEELSLRAATWDEIKSEATKTGKLTVVDVWSLACEPCLKEFPGLVAIDRDMGDSVACFAVDSDFDGRKTKPAESYRPRVEAFLKSVDAKFPNFLCTTPSDELFTELEIESIPAVLIFDAKGKLVRKFVDAGDDAGFTYHDNIVPFIKELLAKQ